MRISVSSWATTDDDVDRSLEAILRIARRRRLTTARAWHARARRGCERSRAAARSKRAPRNWYDSHVTSLAPTGYAEKESLNDRSRAVARERRRQRRLARHAGRLGGRGRVAGAGRDPGADRLQRRLRLSRRGRLARRRPGAQAGPHLQPQHQPDRARLRGEGPHPRGRRGGHELLHRHGGDQQHAVRAALARRPRRLGQGHLRRHQPAVPRLPAAPQGRGRAVRHDRPRADRGGHRPRLQGRLPGDADQPDAQGDGHRPAGRRRPRGRRRSW